MLFWWWSNFISQIGEQTTKPAMLQGLIMTGMLDQIEGRTAADGAVPASIKAAASKSSENWQNISGKLVLYAYPYLVCFHLYLHVCNVSMSWSFCVSCKLKS